LHQAPIIARPININEIEGILVPVSRKFIQSLICVGDYYIFATQIDAFIRNDSEVDPCALDTINVAYPVAPIAKVLQKSFKRTT
jgi:hypothetical protein